MRIISLVDAEKRIKGVVAWDDEASDVGEELTSDVEEDEEEVGCSETKEGVDFWNGGLFLQVVQDWIFGELWTRYVSIRHKERCV